MGLIVLIVFIAPGLVYAGGLDMSVLEAVQLLQRLAQLDRKVEGQKLVLSMKKKEYQF